MDTDDEELKETKRKFNSIYGQYVETSLYEKELQEKNIVLVLRN